MSKRFSKAIFAAAFLAAVCGFGAEQPAARCEGGACTAPAAVCASAAADAPKLTGKKAQPYFSGDINALVERAQSQKKILVMSLGREVCGRCQIFYGYLESGKLVFDESKCIYAKLRVDDPEQREFFLSYCSPDDRRLPYLGIYDPETGDSFSKSGGGTLEACREFFKAALKQAK